MNLGLILLLVVIIFMLGIAALPTWPYGGFGYGYYPSGGLGLILLVVLLLILLGRHST